MLPGFRPCLESLEDRVVPAFNLTVGSGSMATAGVAITTSGSTTTFTANADNAFLNVADMATALTTGPVVVETDLSGPSDMVILGNLNITDTAGALTIDAGHGIAVSSGAVLNSTTANVTLNVGQDTGVGSALIQGTIEGLNAPVFAGGNAPNGTTTLLLDYANGASLPSGLSYLGTGGIINNLTVSDQNGASAHTYAINYGSITRDSDPAIDLSYVTTVSVVGGNLDNTFNITPVYLGGNGQGTPPTIAINGGPGQNTLNISTTGHVGTFPGGLSFHGLSAATYTDITTISFVEASTINAINAPDTADRSTAFTGLTANEHFVQALYLDVLGRAGSKAELDYWAATFNVSGETQADAQTLIATGIEHSTEASDLLVDSWYTTFLNRSAAGEETGWVNMLQSGQTEEQVLSQFLGSAEFFKISQSLFDTGTPQQRYVETLFRDLLNRAASSYDISVFSNLFSTNGQTAVAASFLGSMEFRTDSFEGYYDVLLHRPSDPVSLQAWVTSNLDMESVRIAFESSSEFYTNG